MGGTGLTGANTQPSDTKDYAAELRYLEDHGYQSYIKGNFPPRLAIIISMKIVILYHPESDHSRVIEEYVHEFVHRNPEISLEAVSVDTREGANTAARYDIVAYPSMLAIRENGELAKAWDGLPLPLMNEVAYFAFA